MFLKTIIASISFTFGVLFPTQLEIVALIDTSGSMKPYIGDVLEFTEKSILGSFVKKGDRVHIVRFDEKVRVVATIDTFKNLDLSWKNDMVADGQFTDLGEAIDNAKQMMEKLEQEATEKGLRKKIVLFFLTDGKNAPPPNSKYATQNGEFHSNFIKNCEIIKQSGWQIVTTAIGSETDAEKLSGLIGGNYVVLSIVPTLREMNEKILFQFEEMRKKVPWKMILKLIVIGGPVLAFLLSILVYRWPFAIFHFLNKIKY